MYMQVVLTNPGRWQQIYNHSTSNVFNAFWLVLSANVEPRILFYHCPLHGVKSKLVKCLHTVQSASKAGIFLPSLCDSELCSFLSCFLPLWHLSLLSLLRVSLNHRHSLCVHEPCQSLHHPFPSITPLLSMTPTLHPHAHTDANPYIFCLSCCYICNITEKEMHATSTDTLVYECPITNVSTVQMFCYFKMIRAFSSVD